jgi:hypothetical protein
MPSVSLASSTNPARRAIPAKLMSPLGPAGQPGLIVQMLQMV